MDIEDYYEIVQEYKSKDWFYFGALQVYNACNALIIVKERYTWNII